MKLRRQRLIATLMAAHLGLTPSLAAWAQSAPPPAPLPTGEADQVEPKFVWGVVVINIVLKYALGAFASWAAAKLTNDLTDGALKKLNQNSLTATIVPIVRFLGLALKSAGVPENAKAGDPSTPLKVEEGKENYQGVHLSLVGFERSGALQGFRPITSGFRTGERFKLRVLPTFDGLLVIENINPKGEKRQIFPASVEQALLVKAGVEILVPIAEDDYFEFTGSPGDEQLVITLRDLRSKDGAVSTAQVFRKDEANGTNFVQETPPGTYPVISQGIRFAHVQ